jgi:hypothetical protein
MKVSSWAFTGISALTRVSFVKGRLRKHFALTFLYPQFGFQMMIASLRITPTSPLKYRAFFIDAAVPNFSQY